MATAAPTTAMIPFRPSSVTEALELADKLAASHLLPTALQKQPSDILVVLLTGFELGLTPMQAIRGINVIQGRGCISADTLVALARRSGVCEYMRCVESNERRATYETKRRGDQPVRMEWTIDQAKRAGLAAKDNWVKFPAAMLRARCKSDICRAVYEDVVQGIITNEEVRDGVMAESRADEAFAPRLDDDAIVVTLADKSMNEWLAEADSLKARIEQAGDVAFLEGLLPEIRVLPEEYLRPIREAYTKRLAFLAPPASSKTQSVKDKIKARASAAEPAPKTISVVDDKGEPITPPTEPPAA